ncbi:MAG: site-specific integrase [Ignavibacteria bacterium]|nr:site-specific integrase [Ignavibacteria bacterium]
MPIYQKALSKGKRFFYKFDLNGKIYRCNAIYLTKGEAKKAEAEAYQEADFRQRHPKESEDITLFKAINLRLDHIKSRKSTSYYNENRRYLKLFRDRMGDIPLIDISKIDIEALLLNTSQRLGINTVNAMIRCYKALFNFSGEYNPCKKIEFYPIDKKVKFIPSNEMIQAVLDISTSAQQDLINFILETGARINEALNLKGRDIGNTFVILYTRKSNNSNSVPRKVPKPDWLDKQMFPEDERVFKDWNEYPKFLDRKIRQLKQHPWGYHSLRHRRASLWSKDGKPLFEIMSLLGHTSLETTQIYLQLIPD